MFDNTMSIDDVESEVLRVDLGRSFGDSFEGSECSDFSLSFETKSNEVFLSLSHLANGLNTTRVGDNTLLLTVLYQNYL